MLIDSTKLLDRINALYTGHDEACELRETIVAIIAEMTTPRFIFGAYAYDPSRHCLIDGRGTEYFPRPQLGRMLTYFAENPRRAITFHELVLAVNNVKFARHRDIARNMVRHLRRVIQDDGSIIRSLPKIGYIYHPEGNT